MTTTSSPAQRILTEITDRVLAQQPALLCDTLETQRFISELRLVTSADLTDHTGQQLAPPPDAVLVWDMFAGLRVCSVHRDHPHYKQLITATFEQVPPEQAEAHRAQDGVEIVWNRPVDPLRGTVTGNVTRVPQRLNDPVALLAFLDAADNAAAATMVPPSAAHPHGALLCNRVPFCDTIIVLCQFTKFLRNPAVYTAWLSLMNRQRLVPTLHSVPAVELRPNSLALSAATPGTAKGTYDNVSCTRTPLILDCDPDLEPDVAATLSPLPYPLPSHDELAALVSSQLTTAGMPMLTAEAQYRVARTLRGLTAQQATSAVCLAITRHGDISLPDAIQEMESEKMAALRASQLTYVPVSQLPREDDIAGYSRYKSWLTELRATYTPAAAAAHVPRPRGMLLLGIPGAGKSVVGLMTARALGVPCVRLDFSALFQGIVGASEGAMRSVLRIIAGLGDCVVFIDEIDKGLAGAETNSAVTDSGVSRRVFGQLLTAMAENTSGAFFIMTANRANALPPETFRIGRVDSIWYVDMPTPAEAEAICRIHLRKRHRDDVQLLGPAGNADIETFRNKLAELVGSEIEFGVVIESLRRAYADGGRDVTLADLERAADETIKVSLKRQHAAALETNRENGKRGARNVSYEADAAEAPATVPSQNRRTPRRRSADAGGGAN